MRKLLYTLLAVSIIFSACKKEEEDNEINNSLIIGTWEMQKMIWESKEGFYDGGYPNGEKIITDTHEDELYNTGLSITFDANNYTTMYYDTVDGGGSYSINGNTLVLSDDGEMEITSLTSSELVLEISEEDTMTYSSWDPNNDTVYFYENESRYELEKSSSISNNPSSKIIQNNKDSFFKTFIDRKKKFIDKKRK